MFLSSCGELVGMTEVHLECGVYPLPNPPPVGEGTKTWFPRWESVVSRRSRTLVLLPPGEGLGRGKDSSPLSHRGRAREGVYDYLATFFAKPNKKYWKTSYEIT